jgi:hypothetical protein
VLSVSPISSLLFCYSWPFTDSIALLSLLLLTIIQKRHVLSDESFESNLHTPSYFQQSRTLSSNMSSNSASGGGGESNSSQKSSPAVEQAAASQDDFIYTIDPEQPKNPQPQPEPQQKQEDQRSNGTENEFNFDIEPN